MLGALGHRLRLLGFVFIDSLPRTVRVFVFMHVYMPQMCVGLLT